MIARPLGQCAAWWSARWNCQFASVTDPVAVGLARAGSALAKIDDGELRYCSTQQRFANWAVELAVREADLDTFFDTVIVCTVTGSSHAGMIVGFALEDRNDRRVIGIDASATLDKTIDQVTRIATNTAELIELGRPLRDDEITVIAGYEGPVYGDPDQQTVDAIQLAARTEGMLTDPVYEGKSMAGLIGMTRSGEIPAGSKVMYCHLGGQPCLSAYAGAPGLG